MKTLKFNYLVALLLTLSSFSLFAQSQKFNSEKSTIQWVGTKIGGQHEGLIKLKSGEIVENNGKIESGSFEVDMTSITCTDLEDAAYNEKLVGHLKSDDFFGVATHPTATVKITEGATLSDGKATVKGDLVVKGKSAPVTFELVKNENGYTTQLKIDRTKYDVRYGSASFFDNLGDKAIADIFVLNITLVK